MVVKWLSIYTSLIDKELLHVACGWVRIPLHLLTLTIKLKDMKDYSKVKFVKPSVDGLSFTKGKVYPFKSSSNCGGWVTNERGTKCFIFIPRSSHIQEQHFIPCDENGKELTND